MTRATRIALAAAAALTFAVPALSATSVFNTHLSGNEQVPSRATHSTGQAVFTLNADRTAIDYRINVSNIQNVVAAKMQNAPAGSTGPDVAVLFGPVAPGGGKSSGVLAKGTLTADKLVGPFAGKAIADLVTEIQAGRIYITVMTDDGQGSPDEKPGDFSSGEIRGQVR